MARDVLPQSYNCSTHRGMSLSINNGTAGGRSFNGSADPDMGVGRSATPSAQPHILQATTNTASTSTTAATSPCTLYCSSVFISSVARPIQCRHHLAVQRLNDRQKKATRADEYAEQPHLTISSSSSLSPSPEGIERWQRLMHPHE